MNQTHIWKTIHLPEVEFFKAEYSDFTYGRHFHEDYAIGVVEDGIHAFYYRHENYAITPGYVVTCQPGEVHTGHPGSDTPWRYRMMYLRPSLVRQVAAELDYRTAVLPFLNQTAFNHPYIVQAIRQLHQQSERHRSALAHEVQLREILAMVLANFSEILWRPNRLTDERDPMEKAQRYMQEHYAEDLQLTDLAQVAHLSKSYFIRAFRHHVGMSPYAYLIQVRLNRAKALLESGLPTTSVAQETGFFDQSHFSHTFKRFMGIPPARYQQAIG